MIDASDIGSQLLGFAPLVLNNASIQVDSVWFVYIQRRQECLKPGTSPHHLAVLLDMKAKNKLLRDLRKEPCVESVRAIRHAMPFGTWLAFSPYAQN